MTYIDQRKMLEHIGAGWVGLGPDYRYTLTTSAVAAPIDVDQRVYELDDLGLVILDGPAVRLSRAGADLRGADRTPAPTVTVQAA